MMNSQDDKYDIDEAQLRFESALRGARLIGHSPISMTPKKQKAQQQKGKPAKASPSSGASRASAKTVRP
jgi:hypothetical protein